MVRKFLNQFFSPFQKNDSKTEVGEAKEKSEAQLKKEAKKREKEEKFKEKQLKAASVVKKEDTEKKQPAAQATEIQVPRYTSNTPLGERKDTKCQLPDAYSPKYVEAAW